MTAPAVAARGSRYQDCSVKFGHVSQDGKPAPPPEATLIRLARQAARIKAPAAARAAGISTARWSQIENGYERREGLYKPIAGTAPTIAHMARAVGLTPDRLEAAGRPDAAEVLTEILTQEALAEPADEADQAVVDTFAFLREWIDWWDKLTPEEQAAERRRIRGEDNGNTRRAS